MDGKRSGRTIVLNDMQQLCSGNVIQVSIISSLFKPGLYSTRGLTRVPAGA
jgi:hypothetical protein